MNIFNSFIDVVAERIHNSLHLCVLQCMVWERRTHLFMNSGLQMKLHITWKKIIFSTELVLWIKYNKKTKYTNTHRHHFQFMHLVFQYMLYISSSIKTSFLFYFLIQFFLFVFYVFYFFLSFYPMWAHMLLEILKNSCKIKESYDSYFMNIILN